MAMDSALIMKFQSSPFVPKQPIFAPPSLNLSFTILKPYKHTHFSRSIKAKVSSNNEPIIQKIRTAAAAIVFAASLVGKFQILSVRAETQQVLTEEVTSEEVKTHEDSSSSPLSETLESRPEAIEALINLLKQKAETGDDEESLKILKDLNSAEPENQLWKLSIGRLLNEKGQTEEAQIIFEEILSKNPLSLEALTETTLLMDRKGEGEEVMKRLEQALKIAEEQSKVNESRYVRLLIAQVQFCHKNVDEGLRICEELTKEDPNDFEPYFCKGVMYSFLKKYEEARENFAKYHEKKPFGEENEEGLN